MAQGQFDIYDYADWVILKNQNLIIKVIFTLKLMRTDVFWWALLKRVHQGTVYTPNRDWL